MIPDDPNYIIPYKVFQVSTNCSAQDLEDFLCAQFRDGYRLLTYNDDKLVFEHNPPQPKMTVKQVGRYVDTTEAY